MKNEAARYVEVFAECPVDGQMRKFKVWVDLLEIAKELGPKALASKAGVANYWSGAVKVSVVKP